MPVSRLDQTGHSQDREANRHPRSRLECTLVVGAMPPRGMHGPFLHGQLLPRRTRTWRPEGPEARHGDATTRQRGSTAGNPRRPCQRTNSFDNRRPMSGTSRPCVCRVLLLRRRCAQSSTSPQDQSVSQINTDVIIPQQFLQSALDWPPQTHQSQLRQPTNSHIPTAFLRGILRLVEGRPRTWRP